MVERSRLRMRDRDLVQILSAVCRSLCYTGIVAVAERYPSLHKISGYIC